MKSWQEYELGYDSAVEPQLQHRIESIDATLKGKHGLSSGQTALAVLDLTQVRLALLEADRIEYAASLAKVGILLAYFQVNYRPEIPLPSQVQYELGLMIKSSSNEMATRYSRPLGLARVQEVLNSYGFYESRRGGGLWMGKHYGETGERHSDPVGGHSHAVTARQLLRFYLLLEQGRLVGPEASKAMRTIFASPQIPHDPIKFVRGLAGRPVDISRKWGSWEDWRHDSGVIIGPGRHYILVALTRHPNGDAYLEDLATFVDDLLQD